MKVYTLTLKANAFAEYENLIVFSVTYPPGTTERVEHFSTEASREKRVEEIEEALSKIGFMRKIVEIEKTEMDIEVKE